MNQKSKSFALIGAAGYVAPRHMEAIHHCGGQLVAALDPNDSVGILDRYFPKTAFFTEFERFDRHIEKLKRKGVPLDYLVVCSPNYLHDAHIRLGLRYGADVICEKPLVLNPWNIVALNDIVSNQKNKVFSILQLRLHPSIVKLKEKVNTEKRKAKYDVELTYITSRGLWYYTSWKGNINKSGGVATNIGVHFFDMLFWIFGKLEKSEVHVHEHDRAGGILILEKAKVKWFLSINEDLLPNSQSDIKTFRSLTLDNQSFDFSNGFEDLHKLSYEKILLGNGFSIQDAHKSIECTYNIRNAKIKNNPIEYHPLVKKEIVKHPFVR